tara:strand:- start:347 stop:1477 length:1131 start_codon:yes stop_codon:yes gene_type:complete
MKITLKRTPEQIELVKAMASRNRTVAYEAQVALAEFIGPVLAEVINNAPTISNLFTSLQFNADDNPSIPLDLYYDINDEDYVKVYSQSHAGGLPTNQVLPTASELKVATYSLDTAVSFDRRYAAKSRMDVVSKTFTRVAQEILAKQETTSASLVMGSLADAETNSTKHVRASSTASGKRFLLDDINKMMTLSKRINGSFLGGTPAAGQARGITDLIVSPEVVEELRSMAYNPINTKGSPAGGTASDGIAATDELRNAVYNSAGLPEFYGISIMEILELGVGKKFTSLFSTAAGTTDYGAAGDGQWDTTDDLVVGLDRSRESLVRAVAVDADNGGEFNLIADDQYSIRQQKIGYFGSLEEGRMVLDDRALVGTIVQA